MKMITIVTATIDNSNDKSLIILITMRMRIRENACVKERWEYYSL